MKTKSYLSVLILSAVTPFLASAQTVPPEPAAAWTVTVTPAYVSQYMFRGVRLGGPSFQPMIEASNGATGLGVWASFPSDNTVPGVSDPEIDPYGYYTFKLTDAVTLVPGFTLYTYPDADKAAGFFRTTFEPSLALNYTVGALKLTPKLYYDFVLEGPTCEVTAAFTLPLKGLGTELNLTGTLGTFILKDAANNASPTVKNWGDYWLVGVSAPFSLTENSKLTVGFAYTEGRDNYLKQGATPRTVNTGAIGRGVVSVSYAWTF